MGSEGLYQLLKFLWRLAKKAWRRRKLGPLFQEFWQQKMAERVSKGKEPFSDEGRKRITRALLEDDPSEAFSRPIRSSPEHDQAKLIFAFMDKHPSFFRIEDQKFDK